MALYSSTLNIARNTSVYFINNRATDTGEAIYVSNNYNMKDVINSYLVGYIIPCFYQLLGYDVNEEFWYYNIQFINNTATNGGDHIYGEHMHSVTCCAALDGIVSYDVQGLFVYLPQKSMSSASSNPIRICLCTNDQAQCQDLHKSITVHPGDTFTLPAAIVGADLGTTVGAVHVIFWKHSYLKVHQPICTRNKRGS